MRCCTRSKWVHLRCVSLSNSKFKSFSSFHNKSCSPSCISASPGGLQFANTEPSFTRLSITYTIALHSPNSPLPLQLFPYARLQTSCPLCFATNFIFCFSPPSSTSGSSMLSATSSSHNSISVFISNARGFDARTAKRLHFVLHSFDLSSCPTLLFHVLGFLDSLLCDLIPLTPGLTFFPLMTGTLAVVLAYLSDPFLNSQSLLLSLFDPYLDCAGVHVLLKNSSCFSFLDVCSSIFCS